MDDIEVKGRKAASEREKNQACLDSSEHERLRVGELSSGMQTRPKVKVAIDIVKANVFAVVIMVVSAIVFLVPFFWIWKDRKPINELMGGFGDWSITFLLIIVGATWFMN